jgi:hypothetical protein
MPIRRPLLCLFAALALASPELLSAAEGSSSGVRSVSATIAPTLKSAQQAINRKEYVAALVEVDKADAMPNKTAYDQEVIDQLRMFVNARLRLVSPKN